MAYCHIAHDCILGDHVVMANSSTLGGHVEVHDYAVLGGATLVHQFCKIGAHVMTAGGSGIQKDVPPFVITHGNFAKPIGVNSEGLKRRNFNENQLSYIKRGFKAIYRKDNSMDEALKELESLANEEEVINLYIDFIKKSTRGLIR
jgi:UDP-N-acetylglucosamine acyltransferase